MRTNSTFVSSMQHHTLTVKEINHSRFWNNGTNKEREREGITKQFRLNVFPLLFPSPNRLHISYMQVGDSVYVVPRGVHEHVMHGVWGAARKSFCSTHARKREETRPRPRNLFLLLIVFMSTDLNLQRRITTIAEKKKYVFIFFYRKEKKRKKKHETNRRCSWHNWQHHDFMS